jgi:cytochrome b subunit of formate dehydrogenase
MEEKKPELNDEDKKKYYLVEKTTFYSYIIAFFVMILIAGICLTGFMEAGKGAGYSMCLNDIANANTFTENKVTHNYSFKYKGEMHTGQEIIDDLNLSCETLASFKD